MSKSLNKLQNKRSGNPRWSCSIQWNDAWQPLFFLLSSSGHAQTISVWPLWVNLQNLRYMSLWQTWSSFTYHPHYSQREPQHLHVFQLCLLSSPVSKPNSIACLTTHLDAIPQFMLMLRKRICPWRHNSNDESLGREPSHRWTVLHMLLKQKFGFVLYQNDDKTRIILLWLKKVDS